MRKAFLGILSILCLMGEGVQSAPLLSLKGNQRTYSLGVEGVYYHYGECSTMEDYGYLAGLELAWHHPISTNWYIQPEVRGAYGSTTHKSTRVGHLKKSDTSNWLIEPRLLLGKRYGGDQTIAWSPYLGFGYRLREDDSTDCVSREGSHGYDRYSHYFYIPLGVSMVKAFNELWSVAPNFEVDVLLYGLQKSYHKLVKPYPVRNHQHRGFALRGELMFHRAFTKGILAFGPFATYWEIKNSDKKTYLYANVKTFTWHEKRNKTLEAGLKVRYMF